MFDNSQRLRLKKDIENVFQNGKTSFSADLGVKTIANNLRKNRITVIIGKKTNKSAVKRNLLKRRTRAAIKQLRPKPGFDIVVLYQKNIDPIIYSEVLRQLKISFKRLKIL